MRGVGKDGVYTVLTMAGLALAMLAWATDGRLAWILRLGGLALITLSAVALLVSVLRQRQK